MPLEHRPVVLLVLDGWGYSEAAEGNAIMRARTPFWDKLWAESPHMLIRGSGAEVGLPTGQMGNSEVGHLNLGAGRVVYQEYTRVSRSISTGSFYTNHTLTDAVDLATSTGKAVHILGLLSPGGVHSHEEHLHAMAELAAQRGASKVYLHAFLDGRDTAPKSAEPSIRLMEEKFQAVGTGRIASLIGRFYAMDRDHRWPRIKAAYDLITRGEGVFQAPSALDALESAYARGESDEFVQATAVVPPGEVPVCVEDGDVVIFMNFRSDRARQITRPFIEPDFDCFEREATPRLGAFVSLTEYNSEFDIPVAYPPDRLTNVLGEYISRLGLHQLRIAETEKYAHVTFFFNGGVEQPFEFEDRILVPSPSDVPTYDQKPEMSAPEVTDKLVEAIRSAKYDFIVCNYANPDMVGHTGNMDATVKAIETLDGCLEQVVTAVLAMGGELLITADHGYAEQLSNADTGQMHTAHTSNPVPLIYAGARAVETAQSGALCDLAPTLLALMGLPVPPEMTGHPLLNLEPATAEATP